MVGQAAIDAGFEKVIFLTEEPNAGGMPNHYSHVDRGNGLAAVCRQAKVPLETFYHSWYWSDHFCQTLKRKLQPGVAIIASDPFRARLVQQVAALNCLTIGEDFGLACCDNIGDVSWTWPALSGVTFNRIDLGRRAAEMMLSLLETEQAPKSSLLTSISAWHPGTTLARRK
jgi:DNA-binding LacI/PurR family transcriptional regulator